VSNTNCTTWRSVGSRAAAVLDALDGERGAHGRERLGLLHGVDAEVGLESRSISSMSGGSRLVGHDLIT